MATSVGAPRLDAGKLTLGVLDEIGVQPCASLGTVPARRLEAVGDGRFRLAPELA